MNGEIADRADEGKSRINRISYRQIGRILIEAGLVTRDQIEKAVLNQPPGRRKKIGELLVDMGYITESQYLKALSEKMGCRFVDLEKIRQDKSALDAIPSDLASKLHVFPFQVQGEELLVATSDPEFMEIEDILRTQTKRVVKIAFATSDQIGQALTSRYSVKIGSQDLDMVEEAIEEYCLETSEPIDLTTEIDSKIISLLNKILVDAYVKRASDIHFDPGIKGAPFEVRFRIDGICCLAHSIPESSKRAIISRIKIMSDLDIAERRKPQSGKFMVLIRGEKVEFRVEITPTVDNNENCVLRILAKPKSTAIDQLGFSPHNLTAFREMIKKPQGVILCAGPTGSGKTTTLHAALGHINKPEIAIWTAEDPVEIRQPGLKQVQVNAKIGYTFSEAMRSFLRADPDVIMIGEIRDEETAKITMEASLTGHLVFSTLHTNSAVETIVRIIDMGIVFYNFADALLGIVAQRLTPRLCEKCKKPYHPDSGEYDKLISYYDPAWAEKHGLPEYTSDLTFYAPQGCSFCDGRGYYGRIAIHEIMTASAPVRRAIRQNEDIDHLREIALMEGMRTLRMDGVGKVLEGITNYEQVLRVCL